jgi:hypothetical protein
MKQPHFCVIPNLKPHTPARIPFMLTIPTPTSNISSSSIGPNYTVVFRPFSGLHFYLPPGGDIYENQRLLKLIKVSPIRLSSFLRRASNLFADYENNHRQVKSTSTIDYLRFLSKIKYLSSSTSHQVRNTVPLRTSHRA